MVLCADTPAAAQYEPPQRPPRARRLSPSPPSFESTVAFTSPSFLLQSRSAPVPHYPYRAILRQLPLRLHALTTSCAHHSPHPAHQDKRLQLRILRIMARRTTVVQPTQTAQKDGDATPTLISPPESKTPPTASHKRNQSLSRTSEPIDASALSKALKDFEQAGKARERTPIASPSRKRPRIQGDR